MSERGHKRKRSSRDERGGSGDDEGMNGYDRPYGEIRVILKTTDSLITPCIWSIGLGSTHEELNSLVNMLQGQDDQPDTYNFYVEVEGNKNSINDNDTLLSVCHTHKFNTESVLEIWYTSH